MIRKSKEISNEYKQSLLLQLEKVQKELHKKVSNNDRILGLFLKLRQYSEHLSAASAPIIERAKEIAEIIDRTTPNLGSVVRIGSIFKIEHKDTAKKKKGDNE